MNIQEIIQVSEDNKLLSLTDKELRLFLKVLQRYFLKSILKTLKISQGLFFVLNI